MANMKTVIRSSVKLDTLARIMTAPNACQVGETALDAVKELVAGDYYSAITCDLKTRATDLFHPGEGWLGPAHVLVQTMLRNHNQHPFVQKFFPRGQSAVYLRSDLLPDRQWQRTVVYNELDRPLHIRDMVAIYQTTPAGQLLILTVGRSGRFRAPELEPVRKLQRILSAVPSLGTDGSRPMPAGQSGVFVQPNEIFRITADDNCSTLLTADKRRPRSGGRF